MSLNWDISEVKDWQKKKRKKRNRIILDVLIWRSMIVGIGHITKKNYKKFYTRLTAYECLHGASLYKGKKPYHITLEDIEMWIGLKTNSDSYSAAQFEKVLLRK